MAWWIATGITTILIIILGALLKLGYSSLVEALKEFKEAIKELTITVNNINSFLERQDAINIYNDKEHQEIRYDLEDYHQRLDRTEVKVTKIETIEENCPANPFKK
jgi:Sec-independent protein translocase protein TatA